MARISDKHGLTNKYRPIGTGKRVVKRGRPRKHFGGSRSKSSRSRASYTATPQETLAGAIIALILVGIVFLFILPFFTPLFIGIPLIYFVDEGLKKKWGLKRGKWSMPASTLWIVVSTIEMVFCMGVLAVCWADDTASYAPLFVSLAVYIGLSILILRGRYIAVLKEQGIHEHQETEFSPQKKQPRSSTASTSTFKYEQTDFDTFEDDDDVDEDDYTDIDEANTKVLCEKLSKSLQVDMAFWNEMHLDFKYNLVTSYTSLQLNFEIKNNSGVPWYNGGGGITLKANFYDKNGNLIHIDDTYIEDEVLVKNRFSDYLYFDYDDISEAVSVQLYAYQEE